jgi:hypothetical protein
MKNGWRKDNRKAYLRQGEQRHPETERTTRLNVNHQGPDNIIGTTDAHRYIEKISEQLAADKTR